MSFHDSQTANHVCDALRSIAVPVFAATLEGSRLVVHLAAATKRRAAVAQVTEALAGFGGAKLRFHNEAKLLAPRSLERLVRRIAGGTVVYDPTGSLTRAKAMVEAAKAVRESLGAKAGGLFYAPRLRTLVVALNAGAVATGDKVKVGALAEIEKHILGALSGAFAGQTADCPAVRVGFGVPATGLVPVDQRSVTPWHRRAIGAVKRLWKPVAVATLFGFGANAAAAKDPAVSQTNLKVTGTGGTANDEGAWFAGGILTAPVGHSWGLQVEGGIAGVDDDTIWGGGAHIFTRDPDAYLLGLFAAYAAEDEFDLDATRLGAEAEIYLNQVSILAKAGYQFSDDLDDGAFGDIELRWYLSNNFVLSGGGSFDENNTFGRAGIEWQPGFSALPGLAFRVDGVVGDDDFDSIMGGITYYFGANAHLKDRHRRQDPDSALFSLFNSVQLQQQKLCAQYGCGPTPPSPN